VAGPGSDRPGSRSGHGVGSDLQQGRMVGRDYEKGENFSIPSDGANRMIYQTYTGRNIYIGNGAHAAGNGAIQGTARELLVDGTLVWRKTQWGHYGLLPIHDQIFTFVPEAEAYEATRILAELLEVSTLERLELAVEDAVEEVAAAFANGFGSL
jgi:hypothetical protein